MDWQVFRIKITFQGETARLAAFISQFKCIKRAAFFFISLWLCALLVAGRQKVRLIKSQRTHALNVFLFCLPFFVR